MKTLAIMAALATAAFAGSMEFGPQVGYWFPTGDAGDDLAGNFYFGGQFLSHMTVIAFEGSIGYISLKPEEEVEGQDFSGHVIPITAGIRSYSGTLYAAGGLELDMFSAEVNDVEIEDYNDNEIGFYIGAGIITPIVGTGDVDISAKLHVADFDTDKMWFGIQGGINF